MTPLELVLYIILIFGVLVIINKIMLDNKDDKNIENMAGTTTNIIDEETLRNMASISKKGETSLTKLTVSGELIVQGNVTFDSANKLLNIIPKGIIWPWHNPNNTSKIPQGWALCDGTLGTPDLRGRFILGSGQGTNLTNRTMGQTGGAETHVITIDEMPNHSHNITTGSGTGCTPAGRVTYMDQCRGPNIRDENIIQKTGGGKAHNNMPPFCVLSYIMKL
jgi:microcystin-dependent protein